MNSRWLSDGISNMFSGVEPASRKLKERSGNWTGVRDPGANIRKEEGWNQAFTRQVNERRKSKQQRGEGTDGGLCPANREPAESWMGHSKKDKDCCSRRKLKKVEDREGWQSNNSYMAARSEKDTARDWMNIEKLQRVDHSVMRLSYERKKTTCWWIKRWREESFHIREGHSTLLGRGVSQQGGRWNLANIRVGSEGVMNRLRKGGLAADGGPMSLEKGEKNLILLHNLKLLCFKSIPGKQKDHP